MLEGQKAMLLFVLFCIFVPENMNSSCKITNNKQYGNKTSFIY